MHAVSPLATLLLGALLLSGMQEGPLDTVLGNMARANQELATLSARLVQQKLYPQLGIEDPPESGEFAVKRKPGQLLARVEIQVPELRIVTLDGRRFLLYQPRIKQAIEGTVEDSGGGRSGTSFLSYFLGGVSRANADYDVSLVGDESLDGRPTSHLRLRKKPSARVLYTQIDLWVDQEVWLPVKQEFIEVNQNLTRVVFDDLRVNVDLPDSHFTIKLPPGVERLRG
jgi:outer membrane lipoprotein-sorting protein